MKRALLLILLLSTLTFAQEPPPQTPQTPLPSPPVLDIEFTKAQIGELYTKVAAFDKWVLTLQARINELQNENAILKTQISDLKLKCKDRCEDKKDDKKKDADSN